jgi:hypothetical protein
MSSRFFFFFSFFSSFSWLRGVSEHGAVQTINVVFGKEVMWMDASQVPNFQQFCEQELQLRRRLEGMQDGRQAPQISAGTVAEAVCFMGALGLGSLLQCDQQLRTEVGQQWFGQAAPIVSDTTMSRSLEDMALDPIRSLLVSAYHVGRLAGLSKWEGALGKHRVGIVDGTCFGPYMASCLEIVGQSALLIDMERIPKRGKELPASHALLRRVKTALGTGCLDLVLGDGLYFNAPFFTLCLEELHSDVLVKTDDAQRDVIVDAMGLFRTPPGLFDGIGRAEGTDVERLCTYQMAMAPGFVMEGVKEPVWVVWIREEYLKTSQIVEFWVIFTQRYGPGLSIEDARELGHLRWDVENHGFKAFNQTMHSKHGYSQKPQVMAPIELLLSLIFILLQVFRQHLEEWFSRAYPGMKMTRCFIYREIRKTIEHPMSPG